jgi:chitodextrinase
MPGRRHLLAALASCAAVLAAGSAAAGGSAAPAADTQPPSVPQGMAFTGTTRTTVGLVWRASTDDVGVVGYRLYRNGARVATVTGLQHTFRSLRCGTRYTFGLEAVDAAGNASYRPEAVGSTTTSACARPTAKPTPKPTPKPAPPAPRTSRPKPAQAARGTANLWIDANGGSCRRSQAGRSYRDAESCRDLQAAYHAARSGDTVGIRTATYPGQTLSAGTKAVTFRAAGPGRPSFGHFVSAAANITVRGILIQDRSERTGACSNAPYGVLTVCGQHQTYDNVIVDGLNTGDRHGIESPGRGFTLKNSEIRNIRDQKGFEGGADDMLIENNYWHDITIRTDGVHNECMFINGGSRSIYRGNLFIGCPVMAMFFTNLNGGPAYRDVLIENNVVGHTLDDTGRWHAGPAFYVGSGYNDQNTLHGWTVRYNTFESGVFVDDLPGGGSSWYGNLGGIDCASAFTYSYNVGQTCGGKNEVPLRTATNDASAPNRVPFYVNAPAGDFRLRAGAAAIDRGNPSAYPRTDKSRKRRPIGRAPDAGAYERS